MRKKSPMLKEGKQAGEKARNKKVLSLLQCGQSPEFLKEITKKKPISLCVSRQRWSAPLLGRTLEKQQIPGEEMAELGGSRDRILISAGKFPMVDVCVDLNTVEWFLHSLEGHPDSRESKTHKNQITYSVGFTYLSPSPHCELLNVRDQVSCTYVSLALIQCLEHTGYKLHDLLIIQCCWEKFSVKLKFLISTHTFTAYTTINSKYATKLNMQQLFKIGF